MHADILTKRTVKEPYFARLLKSAITAAVPVIGFSDSQFVECQNVRMCDSFVMITNVQ